MVVGDFPIEIDTLVVGSGPGGYVAAIRAAQLGQKVTIVEKENLGGVCLNVGCIPSKALIAVGHRYANAKNSDSMGITATDVKIDFSKAQAFKDGVVKKLTGGVEGLLKGNKVDIVQGEAYFVDAIQFALSLKILHKRTNSKMQSLQLVPVQLKFRLSNIQNALSTLQAL